MGYFQRNCFIFEVKILKEVRLSENSSILVEIRFFLFFWNNGGQKHSLSIKCQVTPPPPQYMASFSVLC